MVEGFDFSVGFGFRVLDLRLSEIGDPNKVP